MKGRTEAIIWVFFVIVVIGVYAVCRRPDPGPATGMSALHPRGTTTQGKADWSTADIENETLRSVVSNLIEQWENPQKLFVDLETFIPEAAGMEGTTKGRMFYWEDRTGPDTLRYLRVANSLTFPKEDGSKIMTAEDIFQLYDGEYLYTLINQPKSKTAFKAEYEEGKIMRFGGAGLFASLFRDYHLTLLENERLGEWDTHVFLARPRDGAWTAKYWFDKVSGVQVQLIESDASGSELLRITAKEIDLDPDIPEDRFTFTLPERYVLTDETVPEP